MHSANEKTDEDAKHSFAITKTTTTLTTALENRTKGNQIQTEVDFTEEARKLPPGQPSSLQMAGFVHFPSPSTEMAIPN